MDLLVRHATAAAAEHTDGACGEDRDALRHAVREASGEADAPDAPRERRVRAASGRARSGTTPSARDTVGSGRPSLGTPSARDTVRS
ncbi:hypothetical protein Saso_55420 [Streptomyces asoensis]|uniref:Uncharacterized protein n=1 Tax=Streptomyces asoensis TaxID=249586 RepID=A0ABQ3S769_9ACTN|nr:hypothetical protein GCM10010496_46210 [Streptomyces asoensis]GHI63892.1 hypothetical protein Saso_55420 [Streptomyces asoensis]